MPDLFQQRAEPIKPVHNPVFATSISLDDVISEAIWELPTMTPNRLRVLFGCYHNTLIKLMHDAKNN